MKKFRWLILTAVVVIAAIAGLLMFRNGQRGGVENYKAELRAKGEKISFAELGFPRKPEGGAGLQQLTNAANQLANQSGFDPRGIAILNYVSPGKARILHLSDKVMLVAATTNWVSWEQFATNLSSASDQLVEIRAATEHPIRYFMFDPESLSVSGIFRYPFVPMRVAAQWLAADVVGSLHTGDTERALQNLQALVRLSNFNREDPTLVAQMIRVAIARLGLSATWEALQHNAWTEADLAILQSAWQQADFFETHEIGFLGERASGERVFNMVRTNGVKQTFGSLYSGVKSPWSGSSIVDVAKTTFMSAVWRLNADEDEMLAFRHYQGLIESVRNMRTKPWPEVHAQSTNLLAELQKTFDGQKLLGNYKYMISSMLIPNHSRALQSIVHREMERRLTITAIALKRFQLRHGKPPATLDELVPEFIPTVPIDLMNLQPLHYKLNADGTFVLYSVGEDGKDDGGDVTPTDPKSAPDLWNARDAVWPTPAE